MSAIDKLNKILYTKSSNKVIPKEYKWIKGELFYLCELENDIDTYQEIRDKDLFKSIDSIKEVKQSKKNKYKPISVEIDGITKLFYNTRHFKEFENNNKIGIRRLRDMCDIEGLNSGVFDIELELISDWNNNNQDYQIYISPITFE